MEKISSIIVLIAAAIIVLFAIYITADNIVRFITRKIVEKRSQNERINKRFDCVCKKLDCQWKTIKEIKKDVLNLQYENKKYWSVLNGVNATVLRMEKALKEAYDPDNFYTYRMNKTEFGTFLAKCEEWLNRLEKDGTIDLEDIKENLSKEEKPAE